MTRLRLQYTTPRGASTAHYGDIAMLGPKLERAPIGAELVVDKGPREGERIGWVEACDSTCGRPRCKRHWFYEVLS